MFVPDALRLREIPAPLRLSDSRALNLCKNAAEKEN